MVKFYITTPLPYVNAAPHIGFALEIVQADIIARYRKLVGDEVIFNTGTDEHGIKIYRKALEEKKDPQEYVDEYAKKFASLKEVLNLSYTNFIRTTDEHHKKAVEAFWEKCFEAGDIYKKLYPVKYCVGCELENTASELDGDGRCLIHPHLEIETIEEENYFFRWSKYQNELLKLYETRPDFVVPETRLHEIKNFVARGLEDFSISRRKEKMPWGIAVPGDPEHVMYVWFDALVNYISTLGWPEDEKTFNDFWPGVQLAGKDNLRQQSAMWQAMLMSAGLPISKQILIHGFITSGGEKMSKSLGNVIDPVELVEKYGTDALRYFLARHIHPHEDSDFTIERFEDAYNGNLANGLGNFAARVMQLAQTYLPESVRVEEEKFPVTYSEALDNYDYESAINYIFKRIGAADLKITETEPFKLVKTDPEKGKKIISELVGELYLVVRLLNPFMPETSEKIKKAVAENKKPETLFQRIER